MEIVIGEVKGRNYDLWKIRVKSLIIFDRTVDSLK